MLHIYNSQTQSKGAFMPLIEGKVGLYVCGMTVYDYCHVGHARTMVIFDMIVRYLRHLDYNVHYVRNITDIDDKIINRANEREIPYTELTEAFIQSMHEDEAALGVIGPDQEPRATDHIDQMIAMIETLVEKGAAYASDNGDVYFSVSAFPQYGEFVHQDVEQLRVGARVDVVDAKRDPLDFVLWKLAKPGEPSWPSPWGEGRPGWHIECSAMSLCCLGKQFDLHGGGIDLRFPHHQNEVAQSDMANGHQTVGIWMHAGHVQINDIKMSKSLNNFSTIRDVLKIRPAEVVRAFMLASHYRSPVNFTQDHLDHAQQALTRFYLALRDVPPAAPDDLLDGDYDRRFHQAMCDDFNTPEAFAVLFDLTRTINKLAQEGELTLASQHAGLLKHLAGIMGFLQDDPQSFLRADVSREDEQEIQALVDQRDQARDQQDWAKADELRALLLQKGIMLEDSADGTQWRRLETDLPNE